MNPAKSAHMLRALKKEVDELKALHARKIELLDKLIQAQCNELLRAAGLTGLTSHLDSECEKSLTGFCLSYRGEGTFFTRCQACGKRLTVLKGTKA